MPSFDTKLEPDMVKIGHGVDNSKKEIDTRFDFKGTSAQVELKAKEKEIHSTGDSDFQLEQIEAVLYGKLTKQGVVISFLEKKDKIEKLGGDKLKLVVPVKAGIDSDTAKKIQQLVKQSKLKVQAAIQGDAVRITGGKKDDLQATMALLRKDVTEVPLSFNNFRD